FLSTQANLTEQLHKFLCFGSTNFTIHDNDAVILRSRIHHSRKGTLAHFARCRLPIITGLGAMNNAAAAKMRDAPVTLAGTSGAFLTAHFYGTSTYFPARFGACRSLPASRQLGNGNLMNQ